MYFDNYAWGNIMINPKGKPHTKIDLNTSSVWPYFKKAIVKDCDGREFELLFNSGQNLFMVTYDGHVYSGPFKKIDEEGNIVLGDEELTVCTKYLIFIGEDKDNHFGTIV